MTEPQYLTITQARAVIKAAYLPSSLSSINRYIAKGFLKKFQIGGGPRFIHPDTLKAFIEGGRK